jgi:quercetin dioxygenase-like cupin family protein
MKVIKVSRRATRQAPAANFTGTVFMDEVVTGTPPSRLRGLSVSFTPGARTAWHTHPVGQTLYVTYESGRVQMEGKPPISLSPGDTVLIPPNVRHWHGAAPHRMFIHLAYQEDGERGAGTQWLEHVTDAEYSTAAFEPV